MALKLTDYSNIIFPGFLFLKDFNFDGKITYLNNVLIMRASGSIKLACFITNPDIMSSNPHEIFNYFKGVM